MDVRVKDVIDLAGGGTPFIEGWVLGERVRNLHDVNVGDVFLLLKRGMDAQNLWRVTRKGNGFAPADSIVYGRFVSPHDGLSARCNGDNEFPIWDFELDCASSSQALCAELFHVAFNG